MAEPALPPRPSLLSPRLWPMWLALAGMCAGARLPWALQRLIGGWIGAFALRAASERRRAARINLKLCFPEKTEAEREQLLRESFRDLGVGFFEFARAWWGEVAPMRRTVRIEGLELLDEVRAAGRGVLMISGHFMTLEMCGRLMCDHLPLAGMYRKHRNPVMEWAVKRGRLR
ncbi:lipid A biosynthesis lauroyl acyltransferase, partial [Lysobacter sp. 2RAB21]